MLPGSAPHTQGTGEPIHRDCLACRFSPAHAGNGQQGARAGQRHAVQPRTRRERHGAERAQVRNAGSAPHTQGTACQDFFAVRLIRFSPAHAGNGWRGLPRGSPAPVQPRTRRERLRRLTNLGRLHGSAPHTQGTDHGAGLLMQALRFSPAHAGNGGASSSKKGRSAVQPRTRRERPLRRPHVWRKSGSAPHTQGTAS